MSDVAQCLNCYGFVQYDNDGCTLLCRGMFSGECAAPSGLSAEEIPQLQYEREEPQYWEDEEREGE